ncbi:type III PLP-dependent enzyme [Microbispora sp. H10885]|uniref:type III PLP-dependent enzyme n=1 Tax=Microbispora sp. H10885 TaxID=2729110 RepID=UPI0015FF0C08|nr:type III PLP-dependent enzyme [Microbispora sp. H10885]
MTDAYAVQGIPVADLADRFGTPLYIYDADVLTDAYTELRRRLHPAVDIFYSAKANPNVSVCSVMRSLGAGLEVSSMAELATARWAGAAPDDVIFLGPGKSEGELRACLEDGIAAVVCESLEELAALDRLGRPGTRVLLRVNPAFTTKGARLSMGGKPRQFGIDHELLLESAPALRALRNVRVTGIHAYMGTRILDEDGVVQNTAGILAAARELSATLGFPLETVDIGGGLGIAYFENEKDLDLDRLTDGVNAVVGEFAAEHPDCRVIMELGRYLAGRSGTYVVRARYVKQSKGEWFVVTDGGMNHHMAAVGVGSFVKRNFPIRSIDHPGELADRRYTITGPLCTPDDVLGRKVALPEVRPGDLIGVERSGAYGPTSSPVLFLSHGYPAEVLVSGGTAHLVRHRDTVEDLLGRQVLVDRPGPAAGPAAEPTAVQRVAQPVAQPVAQ